LAKIPAGQSSLWLHHKIEKKKKKPKEKKPVWKKTIHKTIGNGAHN